MNICLIKERFLAQLTRLGYFRRRYLPVKHNGNCVPDIKNKILYVQLALIRNPAEKTVLTNGKPHLTRHIRN